MKSNQPSKLERMFLKFVGGHKDRAGFCVNKLQECHLVGGK